MPHWPKCVNPLNKQTVREWLSYDGATGKLFWLKHIKPKLVGSEAGRVRRWDGALYKYGTLTYFGKQIKIHRMVWIYHHGEISIGLHIDHINGDSTDNRIEDLRLINVTENNRNSAKGKNNTTDFPGVSFNVKAGKWHAAIGVGGKTVLLGCYPEKHEAVIARQAAEKVVEYHPNHWRKKTKKVLDGQEWLMS